MLSVQGRYASLQYDDDLNTLPLGQYYVMDLFAGHRLQSGLTVYVAGENLLNQRYASVNPPPYPLRSSTWGRRFWREMGFATTFREVF